MYTSSSSCRGMIRCALILANLITTVCLLGQGTVHAQEGEFEAGSLLLKASHEVLFLPQNVWGLEFDTASAKSPRDVPDWQLLGENIVSGVFGEGGLTPLTSESQIEDVIVLDTAFLDAMHLIRTARILRLAPTYAIDDTLYYDTITERTYNVPDLSRHYLIAHDTAIAPDSALVLVAEVDTSLHFQSVPVAVSDECDGWVPTDPAITPEIWDDGVISDSWYLHGHDAEDLVMGANVFCAWERIADRPKGDVRVAVIDLPYEYHADLDGNILYGPDCDTAYAATPDRHGLAVAGIIGMVANNGIGSAGVAPDVEIVYANRLEGTMAAWYDDFYRIALDTSNHCPKPDVICLSYSTGTDFSFVEDQLLHCRAHQIPVVVSSGTTTNESVVYPSRYDSTVISVGALTYYGTRRDDSNWPRNGERWLDVMAPGTYLYTCDTNSNYAYSHGTSAAAPVVAGLVALAKAYNPTLHVDAIEDLLHQSAEGVVGYDSLMGYGRVNADSLMALVILGAVKDEVDKAISSSDWVPSLIITSDSLASSFQQLADDKTRFGTITEVITMSEVDAGYSGTDSQERIRNCIKYYHDNKYTDFVILGGDESNVPVRHVYNNLYGPGVHPISDHYYACLGGTWNYDSDTLWGELEDSCDIIADVAVGRIPVSNSAQVSSYIAKLQNYKSGSPSGWQTRALAVGNELWTAGDGVTMCEQMVDTLSGSFSVEELYDDVGGTASRENYVAAVDSGQGIILQYCQAPVKGDEFYIRRESNRQLISVNDIDTLANSGMPSFVYSLTCFNHNLDSNCVAEHYINHAGGGAVAYVGTSYNDYTVISHSMAQRFFGELINGTGNKEIGRLLNIAKQQIIPKAQIFDGPYRHMVMGYALSGDPQLELWTETPVPLTIQATDPVNLSSTDVDVTVTSGGNPVSNVRLCLTQDSTLFDIAITDANGQASFTSIDFVNTGTAYIGASKHNYIPELDSIVVNATCCAGSRGNIDCSVSEVADIGDLNALIDHLFISFEPLCCEEEADLDSSGTVDVGDQTILVDHLFISFAPLISCP